MEFYTEVFYYFVGDLGVDYIVLGVDYIVLGVDIFDTLGDLPTFSESKIIYTYS